MRAHDRLTQLFELTGLDGVDRMMDELAGIDTLRCDLHHRPGVDVPVISDLDMVVSGLVRFSVLHPHWTVTVFCGAGGAVITAFELREHAESVWLNRSRTSPRLHGFLAPARLFNPLARISDQLA